MMNYNNVIISIILISSITLITRFLPFLIFRKQDKVPGIINFLGKFIPGMVMMILVVYCLKDITPENPGQSLNIIISSFLVVILHLLKKNALLSITGGTVLYMILLQNTI